MARLKTKEKIDDVKKRRDQLDAQLKALEKRQRAEVRKNDTRRNILAGAMALEYRDKNPDDHFSIKLNVLIKEHVKRPLDRKLFGLEPVKE